jgi:hypothetical protein
MEIKKYNYKVKLLEKSKNVYELNFSCEELNDIQKREIKIKDIHKGVKIGELCKDLLENNHFS